MTHLEIEPKITRPNKLINKGWCNYMSNQENAETYGLDAGTLKKILDNSYDEIFVLDRDDRVVYVNKVCEKHYGLKQSEVIGKHLIDLFNLEYWTPPITPTVHLEKRQVTIIQTTHLGKKLVTTVTPVFDEHGDIELTVHNARDLDQIEAVVRGLDETRKSLSNRKKNKKNSSDNSTEFIAHSHKMQGIIMFAERVASVDSTVLILGESGTGKGVLAGHIHENSRRKEGPFLAINCAAIPEDLLESELFGYSQGAFTGADRGGKKGLIELADGGTLFLDEIAELSPRLQAKILQVIQDRRFISVGGTQVKTADVRIISATNQDLLKLCDTGKFRKDLYYRLNVIEIKIPPLRDRPEDIAPLVYFFINKFAKKYDANHDISQMALDSLCRYSWPGNVRELENVIERLIVTVREPEIDVCHLPENIEDSIKVECKHMFPINTPLELVKTEIEKDLITRAYTELSSTRKVAKALKISQTKASRLIRKYCGVESV